MKNITLYLISALGILLCIATIFIIHEGWKYIAQEAPYITLAVIVSLVVMVIYIKGYGSRR